MHGTDRPARPPVSRRALLAGAATAAGLGATAGVLEQQEPRPSSPDLLATPLLAGAEVPTESVPFHGLRQAGVATTQQPYTLLLGYDLTAYAATRAALRALLADWTEALADASGGTEPSFADRDVRPDRLTAAVGVGSELAVRLSLNVPETLRDLPAYPGDRLDPARGGGDLLVQLCATDRWPLTATANLLLARAAGRVTVRWSQHGFLPREPANTTPRNLLGFKDGTANPDPDDQNQWVWLPPGLHEHGTLLVYRRIRLDAAAFAALPLPAQQAAVGRRRHDGAPLGGHAEHDEVELWAKNPDGSYVIPFNAHIRLANPRFDAGARMLRRGYSYDDGAADQGLLFCAFMRDPALFTRVQSRLAATDALLPYTTHVGSAVAYILPGPLPGHPLGATL